ncbi:MAG: hypothetical protein JWM14_3085 [Chitinophagaceae bacterium]|nr:hypothetical protein [Chitinophagaceae bacterium]
MILLIVLHICFLLFYLYVQQLFEKDKPLYSWFYTTLVIKVLSGLAMGALYLYYYTPSDLTAAYSNVSRFAVLFYSDNQKFIDIYVHNALAANDEVSFVDLHTNAPRLWFFVKLIVPLGILIDNYWMLNVYISIFSFMGLWNLANRIVSIFPISKTAVVIAFLLFPSVVFWSSGLIKESVLLGSIGFSMSFYLKWVYERRRPEIVELIIFILALWIIWNVKYYVFSILFFLMITHFAHRMVVYAFPWLKEYRVHRIVIYYLVLANLGLSAGWIHPNLSIENLYNALHQNYIDTLILSNNQNVFHLNQFDKGEWGMLWDLPKALICGMFGPFVNTGKGWIAWLAVIENYVLLLVVAYFLVDQTRKKWKGWTMEHLIVVNYIILMAAFLSFASPNWGTLIRYKVVYMPLLLLLLLSELPIILKLDFILFPEIVKETERKDILPTKD